MPPTASQQHVRMHDSRNAASTRRVCTAAPHTACTSPRQRCSWLREHAAVAAVILRVFACCAILRNGSACLFGLAYTRGMCQSVTKDKTLHMFECWLCWFCVAHIRGALTYIGSCWHPWALRRLGTDLHGVVYAPDTVHRARARNALACTPRTHNDWHGHMTEILQQ